LRFAALLGRLGLHPHFNLTTRTGWRASKGFVILLAAIRGKKKTTVAKLTHAIAVAGRGSSMRPSLILWPS
jgi:hypothetical protein